MRARALALLPVLALLPAHPGAAADRPRPVLTLEDPAGDATGPGSYQPPGDSDLSADDFDLRRFTVSVDGDQVILEVTLGATLRRPQVAARTNSAPLELTGAHYVQNVDVYVDTDPAAAGFSACIPGRRVAFADGRTWKAAVVLAPQPGPVRAVIEEALGDAAAHVAVPDAVQARGKTLVARVPAALFGGLPRPEWGWSVQVSGAAWERSYGVQSRLQGKREPDAYTMDVTVQREAWTFGGAPEGSVHPRVVDLLLPPGADQARVLGGFDVASGSYARVPFVYGVPPPPAPLAASNPTPNLSPILSSTPPAAAPAPPPPNLSVTHLPVVKPLTVVDTSGGLVSLSGTTEGLKPFQLGQVLGADGATVARLVVVQVFPGGLVANAVEGGARIEKGLTVVFDRR